MGIADYLEDNRAWLGFVLLVASWAAVLLPDWARIAVVIVSIAIILVGMARFLTDYKANKPQPGYTLIDKVQIGLTLVTMLIVAWFRFAQGHYGGDGVPELMPLLALINLPRTRHAPPSREDAKNA